MARIPKILIVDDDASMLRVLEYVVKEEGYSAHTAKNAISALALIPEFQPDLIITDLQMPNMNGLELMQEVKKSYPGIVFVMLTAYGTVQTAVEAMKLGALEYLTKPFNRDELKALLAHAVKFKRLEEESRRFRQLVQTEYSFDSLIGKSLQISQLRDTLRLVAGTDSTVLISGETGTGKELVAKIIHYMSLRISEPFIAVNCAAIPETLIESELFGHVKGSFTGATSDRAGKFERADGGTIFLDEIGEMKKELQSKLLRVLEEKEIERVGGTRPIKLDVRVIAATNRNLENAIAAGEFRRDLYYRLNVVSLTLPPVREHQEDIPELIQHFFSSLDKPTSSVSAEAMELLLTYDYPGNVRELENIIESALLFSGGRVIEPQHLPEQVRERRLRLPDENLVEVSIPQEGISLEAVEKSYLIAALKKTRGNQTAAAKLLGITRHTLIYRMEKYGISKEVEKYSTLT
ncbi:MAG: sigma-54 dependent transcriptional regulator [bacterium]|nr:sigma-54 dependent transcriptional regulator [bacterium]